MKEAQSTSECHVAHDKMTQSSGHLRTRCGAMIVDTLTHIIIIVIMVQSDRNLYEFPKM